MASRLELQNALCKTIGNRNVYFQPPESVKLTYPCVVYSLTSPDVVRASDSVYKVTDCYEVTYISKTYNEGVIRQFLTDYKMCRHSRHYVADNLYHDNFTIYY